MKLWKVERTDFVGYDEFDGWIIAHHSAELAISLTGYGHSPYIEVSCIGEALPDAVEGSILFESFNAG